LARANKIQQRRVNEDLMKKGVTIIDPETTFISFGSKVGAETVIYPFTVIENDVKIGKRCSVGPFAHLREGTNIDNDVLAGNFLEIVRSTLGSKTFIKHFSYIGDSRIGKSVNIGAGTVTANFDGKKKNFTIIKDNALIGSDTILVAPAKIGKNSVTGAGSVIVKNIPVPDNAIVVGVPARQLKIRKKG
jgi:bifunctional UDP-N-acetylglucosamine pyrophosphorylase/glucosamine-1-phosphate N-acetyltransferase